MSVHCLIGRLVCRFIGYGWWSVRHSLLKGWEVTLPCFEALVHLVTTACNFESKRVAIHLHDYILILRSSAAGSGYLLPPPPTSNLLPPSPGRRGGLLYPPPPDNLLQASPGQLLPGGHGLLFSLPWLAQEPQQEQPQPPDSNGWSFQGNIPFI